MPQETRIKELINLIKNFMFFNNYGIVFNDTQFFDIGNSLTFDIENRFNEGVQYIDALPRLKKCNVFDNYSNFELQFALRKMCLNSTEVNAEIKDRIKLIAADLEKYKAKYH